MLPFLLGLGVVSTSWLGAHLLSKSGLALLRRRFLDPQEDLLPDDQGQGEVTARALRTILFILFLLAAGAALVLLIGLDPLRAAWQGRLSAYVGEERTRSLINAFLEYLLLFLGLAVAVQMVAILNRVFPRLYKIVEGLRETRLTTIRIQSLELLTPDQLTDLFLTLAKTLRAGATLLISLIALTFSLSFFPGTEGVMLGLLERALAFLGGLGQGFLNFLPNLVNLALIILLTRYTLKGLRFFAAGFRNGKIALAGFHPELAEPTYQLARVLVVALALVAAFPYIPGSDSPVFRGISIFIGALVSLGSTSLVTNIVSGVVLTYTRGLKIGDRVQIGENIGDVVERSLLVTRLRTIKNVEVTIPNGMVLSSHIINYSASSHERGLILNTTITISYDAPWRVVHELLVSAAINTDHILEFPEPFVLQTSLADYYVTYELNAYTMKASRMANIYSELHQNIQDRFNEAEIEILSPAYSALRDGHQASIPKDYLPNNYRAPGFRTYSVKRGRITEPLRPQ